MKNILFVLALFAISAFAQHADQVIPRDARDVPITTGLGKPYSTNAVTLTTGSYASWLTIPTSGAEYSNRTWKGMAIYNPSSTRTVYACIGNATSCTQDAIIVAPSTGVALDQLSYGLVPNLATTVWGKLDSAGSVAPILIIW